MEFGLEGSIDANSNCRTAGVDSHLSIWDPVLRQDAIWSICGIQYTKVKICRWFKHGNDLKYTNFETSNGVEYTKVDFWEQTQLLGDMGKEGVISLPLKYNNIGKFKVKLKRRGFGTWNRYATRCGTSYVDKLSGYNVQNLCASVLRRIQDAKWFEVVLLPNLVEYIPIWIPNLFCGMIWAI